MSGNVRIMPIDYGYPTARHMIMAAAAVTCTHTSRAGNYNLCYGLPEIGLGPGATLHRSK